MAKKPKSLADTARADGRYDTTNGFVHHMLGQAPQLQFNPKASAKTDAAWRRQVKRKLKQLMAFPDIPKQPAPKLISTHRRKGYSLQKWELYPEPHCVVPFLMLVPDGVTKSNPAPAIMCFPGSAQPKEAVCGEPWKTHSDWVNRFGECNHFAQHYVRQGFVALAFDNPGTASVKHALDEHWHRNSLQIIWAGRSYEGISVFQKHEALQWLKKLPFVDKKRIATCGHSLGAKPALLLGLLDNDVSAVIWNDMVTNWVYRDYVTNLIPVAPWHYIPDFIHWFDYVDLMAALAPTPFLVTEGGRLDDHALIRKSFKKVDASSNVTISFMPNFRDPKKRCKKAIPLGIKDFDYSKYANYDGDHYFKDDVAVPWLCKQFGVDMQ